MTLTGALLVFIVLIVMLVAFLWGPTMIGREKPGGEPMRERYGPPPGMHRALDHRELSGDRGWVGLPEEYMATTAGAISGLIERSA